MDRRYSGRFSMHLEALVWLAVLGLGSGVAQAWGAEAPAGDTGTETVPVTAVDQADAAYQVVDESWSRRWLDEAIFTEISPVIVPDVGILLPEDQRE